MTSRLIDKVSIRLSGNFIFFAFLIFLIVLSAVGDLTKFTNLPPQFIGHADQANIAIVAKNISQGNGAVVDSVWLHTDGGVKGDVIPAPEHYWSIYTAAIIAIFFWLFSPNLTVMLIPAVIVKILIALSATRVTWKITNSGIAAITVATILLCHPIMTRYVNGLSDIYLSLLFLSTCLVLAQAILKDSSLLFLFVGLLIGLSIGVKPSGGLLIGLLVCYFVFAGNFIQSLQKCSVAVIGIVLGLLPLLIHNYVSFGSFLSPGVPLVRTAASIAHITGNHNQAFYDPEGINELAGVNYTELQIDIFKTHAEQFSNAIGNGLLVPVAMYPFVLVGVLSILFTVRSVFLYRNIDYEKLLGYLFVQILIAGCVLGVVVHWETRYWNFLVPFLTIATIVVFSRFSDHQPILKILYPLIILGTIGLYVIDTNRFTPRLIPAGFTEASEILPKNSVVLTSDPWEFSFHSGLKTVALPYTAKDSVLIEVAEKYDASYIAIVDGEVRHTKYSGLLNQMIPEYLELVHQSDQLFVLEFKSRIE